ncbi:MAG: phosphate ABC transporter substrate-binding protein PstS [Candidatus Nanopelagicales bacterium]
MKTTKTVMLTAAAAASVFALAACGSSGSNTSSGNSNIDCASGSIKASGSSAQKNAITDWINAYQEACEGATIDYQANGSGAGIQDFINAQTAFAGTDAAAKDKDLDAATKRCASGPAINIPMVGGAVVAAYNVEGVDKLVLTPKTLAGIFSNKITKWNDPAIAADNQGTKLPDANIVQFHRSDSSGTTANFTDFLSQAAKADWTYEPGKEWAAPGGQGAKGTEGVTSAVSSTANSIGYVELSFAQDQKLKTATLKTAGGEVEPTSENASKAIAEATVVGSGNNLALELKYDTAAQSAYPIVLVTYELTCEKGLPENQLGLTKSFLTYTSSNDAQKQLTEIGYVPIPDSLLTKVQDAVKAIS